ncbi:unnamed protein product, partial [Heterosigma akashiwo]
MAQGAAPTGVVPELRAQNLCNISAEIDVEKCASEILEAVELSTIIEDQFSGTEGLQPNDMTELIWLEMTATEAAQRRRKEDLDQIQNQAGAILTLPTPSDGEGGGVVEAEQLLVARFVHLLECEDTDALFEVYLVARRHFGRGGVARLQHTLVPLAFGGLGWLAATRPRKQARPGGGDAAAGRPGPRRGPDGGGRPKKGEEGEAAGRGGAGAGGGAAADGAVPGGGGGAAAGGWCGAREGHGGRALRPRGAGGAGARGEGRPAAGRRWAAAPRPAPEGRWRGRRGGGGGGGGAGGARGRRAARVPVPARGGDGAGPALPRAGAAAVPAGGGRGRRRPRPGHRLRVHLPGVPHLRGGAGGQPRAGPGPGEHGRGPARLRGLRPQRPGRAGDEGGAVRGEAAAAAGPVPAGGPGRAPLLGGLPGPA